MVSLTGPVFVNRYTKTNREDNSGCHQLELGWIKVTNLLPESPYRVSTANASGLTADKHRKQLAGQDIEMFHPHETVMSFPFHF